MHKKSFTFGLGLAFIMFSIVFYAANFFENKELIALERQRALAEAEELFNESLEGSSSLSSVEPIIITEELSDDDIIKKASELGMVFIDYEDVLSYAEELLNAENNDGEPVVETNNPEGFEETDNSEESEEHEESEGLAASSEVPEFENAIPERAEYTDFVSIRINGGMTAVSIARLLASRNVVNDANDFLDFLVKERVTTTLAAGEMRFPLNAEYNDILNVLRRKIRY